MARTYYYEGRDGDPFTDATIHAADDCPDLPDNAGAVRPIHESSVDHETADWCGACVPFESASASESDDSGGRSAIETDDLADATDAERDIAGMIEMGVCPWCPDGDRYEGEYVGRHASSAHPQAWDAYKTARDD